MKELITRLQNTLNASNEFTEEEKDIYFFRLESLKFIKDDKVRLAIEAWAKAAVEDLKLVRVFFKGMDEFFGTFIKDGEEAAAQKLQESRDALKKDA